jgi:hypothetical protein
VNETKPFGKQGHSTPQALSTNDVTNLLSFLKKKHFFNSLFRKDENVNLSLTQLLYFSNKIVKATYDAINVHYIWRKTVHN